MPRTKRYEKDLQPVVVSAALLTEIHTAIPEGLAPSAWWSAASGEDEVSENGLTTFLGLMADFPKPEEVALEVSDVDSDVEFRVTFEKYDSFLYFSCPEPRQANMMVLARAVEGAVTARQRRTHLCPKPLARPRRLFHANKFSFGPRTESFWSQVAWNRIVERIIGSAVLLALGFLIGKIS